MYCDVNGIFATKQYNGLAEKGTTYAGLKELMQSFRPDDMSEKYTFARWVPQENPYYEDDAPLSESFVPYYYLTAAYEDAKMIRLESEYYDEKGLNKMGVNSPVDMKALMVDNPDATYAEILAAAENVEIPETYPGLTFDHWDYVNTEESTTGVGGHMTRYAVYDKGLVRIQLYKGTIDKENLIYNSNEIMDGGTEYSLPSKINGYNRDDISWAINPGSLDGITVGTEYGDNDFI